ncbi:hypothetical protein RB653_010530 [Dictyostelium firmibasis]|uniref:Endonuclease V n=1 Tax=Dictyostelium firmibasis TaxID=79012 RepID=A0AAN7TU39_9MYCE
MSSEQQQPPTNSTTKQLKEEEIEQQNKWIEIQNELKKNLIEKDDFDFEIGDEYDNNNNIITTLKYIGGVDISFVKDNDIDACASLIVIEYPSLKIVYKDIEFVKLTELYIPGFLAFRETPHLIKLVDRLKQSSTHNYLLPQIIMIDGNGILHPRGFGLASHLGVLIDIPTIGVGKTFFHVDGLSTKEIKSKVESERLKYLSTLSKQTDTTTTTTTTNTTSTNKNKNKNNKNKEDINIEVQLKGESGRVWGSAILSNSNCKNPIYVSVGHRVSLETALKVVKLTSPYRVPESIRQADLLSRDYIRLNFNKIQTTTMNDTNN